MFWSTHSLHFPKPQKAQRQYVHLSANQEIAVNVGQRHGKPVVLTVNTEQMTKDGLSFYLSENGVWLTEKVPVEYLVFTAA